MPDPAQVTLSSRSLISALTDPVSLQGLRTRFRGLDPVADIRPLVVELIDPQLLRVALGPELGPVWAPALEKIYGVMRDRHPAHFHDVHASWRRQRDYWYAVVRSGRKQAEAADEASAEASSSSGAHGGVVDRTQGREPQAGVADAETASSNGRARRIAQPKRFGEAADPDPDVEDAAPVLHSGDGPLDGDPDDPDQDDRGGRGASSGEGGRSSSSASVIKRGAVGLGGGAVAVSARSPGTSPEPTGSGPPSPSAFLPPGSGEFERPTAVVRPGAVARSVGPVLGPAAKAVAHDPAAGVSALLAAMLDSPQAFEKFRQDWIATRGGSQAWEHWSLPGDLAQLLRERGR